MVFFKSEDFDGLDQSKDYLFGGRTFTVYEVTEDGVTEVFTSGDDFEALTWEYLPDYYNCSNDNNVLDDRSGKKGPEAESVTVGQVDGRTYAFIALERTGGVMVYDVTDPDNSAFVNYINSRDFTSIVPGSEEYDDGELDKWVTGGDVAPEGLAFIPAAQSHNGKALLLAACEVSGTVAVYELTAKEPDDDEDHGGSGGGSSVTRYTITASAGEGGSISPSGSVRVTRGGDRTFTITAEEGYEISDVLVDGESVGAVRTYTFEDVRAGHTIEARFSTLEETQPGGETDIGESDTPLTPLPFTDVDNEAWYAGAVRYVVDNGLMEGTSAATFAPGTLLTRSMLAQILYNMEGRPATAEAAAFTDVDADAWYAGAVAWAAAQGIVTGYGDGAFGPGDPITREQVAAILYRYAQYKGEAVTASGDLSAFTDSAAVSSWAQTAMAWAVGSGLINGKDGGVLDPQGSATRAEATAILMRYCQ